jgi:uncharacterized protein YutE (UPF0331/DUF86 family)
VSPARIDLKVVSDRLRYAEECVAALRGLPAASLGEFLADRRNVWSADSLLRRGIEAIFDTARHLLAKRFGIGALEYRAIAREAVDKRLITDPELGRRLFEIAGYRNRLVHHYEDVTPEELYRILCDDLGDLERAIRELRAAAARLAEDA